MLCERCKKDVPSSQLRVDTKNSRLVCEECYTLVKTGMLVPEKTKQEAKKDYSEVRKKLTMSTSERLDKLGKKKEEFQCKKCNYKFTSVRDYDKKCPYCGEDAVIPFIEEVPVKEIDELV